MSSVKLSGLNDEFQGGVIKAQLLSFLSHTFFVNDRMHVCAYYPQRAGDITSPGTGVTDVVSHCVGTGT